MPTATTTWRAQRSRKPGRSPGCRTCGSRATRSSTSTATGSPSTRACRRTGTTTCATWCARARTKPSWSATSRTRWGGAGSPNWRATKRRTRRSAAWHESGWRLIGPPGELPGRGVGPHLAAAGDVLGHQDLDAGGQRRRLRPFGGGAALELRRRLDHLDRHALRELQRHRRVVDQLHVAAGQVVHDVAGGVADQVGVERVRRVVLVVQEHESLAVAGGGGRLPARPFHPAEVDL